MTSLETQVRQLIARNGDLSVQADVDKKMKTYLFQQWEIEKKRAEELEKKLLNETRRSEDARAQARADNAMKEYLTEQWQREEERVRRLVNESNRNNKGQIEKENDSAVV